MDRPFLVDTDVMVDFLRGHPEAVALIRAHSTRIIVPTIVAAELFSGVRDEAESKLLDSLLALFRAVPVSREIARAGGLYRRAYAKSHGIGLADAIVAASADAEGAELATLNIRHYPMFKGLRPAYPKFPEGRSAPSRGT